MKKDDGKGEGETQNTDEMNVKEKEKTNVRSNFPFSVVGYKNPLK